MNYLEAHISPLAFVNFGFARVAMVENFVQIVVFFRRTVSHFGYNSGSGISYRTLPHGKS